MVTVVLISYSTKLCELERVMKSQSIRLALVLKDTHPVLQFVLSIQSQMNWRTTIDHVSSSVYYEVNIIQHQPPEVSKKK